MYLRTKTAQLIAVHSALEAYRLGEDQGITFSLLCSFVLLQVTYNLKECYILIGFSVFVLTHYLNSSDFNMVYVCVVLFNGMDTFCMFCWKF